MHTWQLAWSVAEHWDHGGRFTEIIDTQRTALAAADRLGDRVAQEKAHGALGRALMQIGDLEGGFEHLSLSLEAQRELGDEPAEALTHTALASLHAKLEKPHPNPPSQAGEELGGASQPKTLPRLRGRVGRGLVRRGAGVR